MPPPLGPFSHTEYHFPTGLRVGEVAAVRSAAGEVLLSYRSFAGVAGVIAVLVSSIVALAGVAAALFLLAEGAPLRAAVVLVLTAVFTVFISLLAPHTSVTLYDDDQPTLSIHQTAMFPSARWKIGTPNGALLAEVRKSPLSRLIRHRWTIFHEGRPIGEAAEQPLGAALLRKLLGKFSRRFEADVVVTHSGVETARILRRPDASRRCDALEISSDAVDRRVLVAVATLVLGGEP